MLSSASLQATPVAVLEAMKRMYTRAEFCGVVDFLRAYVPGVHIATGELAGWSASWQGGDERPVGSLPSYNMIFWFPRGVVSLGNFIIGGWVHFGFFILGVGG